MCAALPADDDPETPGHPLGERDGTADLFGLPLSPTLLSYSTGGLLPGGAIRCGV